MVEWEENPVGKGEDDESRESKVSRRINRFENTEIRVPRVSWVFMWCYEGEEGGFGRV